MSGDEVQQTGRATAGMQILQRSVSTPEKRDCWAEISDTNTAGEFVDFMVNYLGEDSLGLTQEHSDSHWL